MERSKSFNVIYERLLEASGSKNDSELARVLNISPQSVNGARKRGEVPPAWIQSYAEMSGVSSDWLFFGRGPKYPDKIEGTPHSGEVSQKHICPNCANLEERLEISEEERRELTVENRKLYREKETLYKEKEELLREIGELREKVARLEERKNRLAVASDQSAQHSGVA